MLGLVIVVILCNVAENKSYELLRKLQIHKGQKLKRFNIEIRVKSIRPAGNTIYESESKFLILNVMRLSHIPYFQVYAC